MATESNAILQILVRVRDEAAGALSRISNDVSDLGGSFNFAFGKADALASALSAIGAGAIIGKAISAFGDAEVKAAQFGAIMQTLPSNLQTLREKILQTADEALAKFGFDNDEAALSMGRLLQATKDGVLTFDAFQAAMDLARAKQIGIEDATRLVILALGGNTRMLKEYGIEIDEHASKATVLAGIQAQLRGQAEAYSQTLNGQLETMKRLIGEGLEALGAQFAPAVGAVAEMVRDWIKAQGGINAVLEKHQLLIKIVAALLVGVLVAGFIVAVAAALALMGTFGTLLAWLAAIAAGVIFFVTLWKLYWDDVKNFFIGVWNSIRDFFSNLWRDMLGIVESATSGIRNTLSSILGFYNSVKATVSQPIQSAASAVSGFVGRVFGFQHGGIVTRPTFGGVGEAGADAGIPLNRLGALGSGGGINVYLQGDFYTDAETAERFANEIARVIKNQLNLAIRA